MEQRPAVRLAEYADITRRGSAVFWVRLKKWFLVAGAVGVLVGLAVTLLDAAVVVIWGQVSSIINPWTVVLAPMIGLTLSGLALQYTTVNPERLPQGLAKRLQN